MSAENSSESITHTPPSFGGVLKLLAAERIDVSRFIVSSRNELAIEVQDLSNKIILYFLGLGNNLVKKELFFLKKTEREFSADFYRTSPFDAYHVSDLINYRIWIKNHGTKMVLAMTFEKSIWKYFFSDSVLPEKKILENFLEKDHVVGSAYENPRNAFTIKPILIPDSNNNYFFLYKSENGKIAVFWSSSAETVESCEEECFPWSCQKSEFTLMVSDPKPNDENDTDKLVVYQMIEKNKWLRVIFEKRSGW